LVIFSASIRALPRLYWTDPDLPVSTSYEFERATAVVWALQLAICQFRSAIDIGHVDSDGDNDFGDDFPIVVVDDLDSVVNHDNGGFFEFDNIVPIVHVIDIVDTVNVVDIERHRRRL
jgi:hypothetical protein